MNNKRWIFSDIPIDSGEIRALANTLGVPLVIASVLLSRNLTTPEAASIFLSKSIKNIHHPFLMKDSEKAANRIKEAVENKESIVIYGDYDVDGITSTAILYLFLKSLGANVSYYIPNRSDEGYGINIAALEKIQKTGASLLITVDSSKRGCICKGVRLLRYYYRPPYLQAANSGRICSN